MTLAASPAREDADIESSSELYARRFAGPVGQWFLELQARLTLECLRGLPPHATVLDVGGGHAQLAGPLADAGYRVTVVGSDASCGHRLAPLTSAGRCRFEVADLLALPYVDRTYDAVVCYRLLAHSIDWRRLVAELCRVSRHRVVVDYPAQRSVNFASEALFRIKSSIERGTTRPFALYGRGEVARAFASAGFRVTEERPQFFLPMALYRLAGSTGLARGAEGLARSVGATALLGSPVIARADRGPDAVGSRRG
ncbi:MAG TPA: class I SAM-dependent methyltransferase [Gemmatimonadales bacterium]|jgi:SAM-dependent methyltransferase|nr:class I SAM-dependent methyltransferase [Gemmatimonadales bacterium]